MVGLDARLSFMVGSSLDSIVCMRFADFQVIEIIRKHFLKARAFSNMFYANEGLNISRTSIAEVLTATARALSRATPGESPLLALTVSAHECIDPEPVLLVTSFSRLEAGLRMEG